MADLTREEARYQVARLIDGEPFMGGPRNHSLRVADQILDYLGWVNEEATKREAIMAEMRAKPEPVTVRAATRSCNRHSDCDAVDARQRSLGRYWADHCYDAGCEDCFGK